MLWVVAGEVDWWPGIWSCKSLIWILKKPVQPSPWFASSTLVKEWPGVEEEETGRTKAEGVLLK